MTARTPTDKTPFRLTFRSEAVILVEVELTNYRVVHHDEERNEEGMRLQLDILDEVRATAEQWIAHYQDLMAKHYNTKVKPRRLEIGNLVLRKVMTATKGHTQGKLGSNWEGPYKIIDFYRKSIYHLEKLNGLRLHHP